MNLSKKLKKAEYLNITACFALLFAILISSSSYAYAEDKKNYALTITMTLNRGNFFARSDVDIYVDSFNLCSIKCGETFCDNLKLKEGSHTIWFIVKNDDAIYASRTITIKEDSNLKCTLEEDWQALLVNEFQFDAESNEEIANIKSPKVIDAYNFTIMFQDGEIYAKRGSFKSYCLIDLENEIKVDVNDFLSVSHKPRATPEKVSIDAEGKIHEYFYFEGSLHEAGTYGMIKKQTNGDYYCIYDKNGKITDRFKIVYIDEPIPSLLKKASFFEKYPTPSSFLDSDSIYPIIGKH